MALPPEVRVKISSEAAGSIAMAEVSVQSLPVRDLIEQMLGLTGKETTRIQEILKRGSLVAGESRLRWDGFAASAGDLIAVLATFPDPCPDRPFEAAKCFHILLLAGRERLDVSPKSAAKRRLFRRRSFWDSLLDLGRVAEYSEYSYRLRSDRYRLELNISRLAAIQAAAPLLRHERLRERVRSTAFDTADFFVSR